MSKNVSNMKKRDSLYQKKKHSKTDVNGSANS